MPPVTRTGGGLNGADLMTLLRTPSRLSALLLAAAALGLLGACSPRIDQRGNLLDPDAVLAVQPGVQTKDQVAQLLGTPSTVATFDDKTWYYISKRTETTSFFRPDITDQQVLVVKFDDFDTVETVKLYGMDDAFEISPVSRVTPTHGQRLTILQQLFGNIGRFTKPEGQ
jgi:outer membrane protein assembly factor BamE (lipoprotein component of BamABCDE complex)